MFEEKLDLNKIQEVEKEKTREELLEEFKNSLKKQGVSIIEQEIMGKEAVAAEEGVIIEIKGEKLVIEQQIYDKERINGLGRDEKEKSNWVCLNQEWIEITEENKKIAEKIGGICIKAMRDEDRDARYFSKFVKENSHWDANQVLALGIDFPGIKMEKVKGLKNIIKIRILPDHPIVALAKLLGKIDKVDLRGGFNSWCEEEKEKRKRSSDNSVGKRYEIKKIFSKI